MSTLLTITGLLLIMIVIVSYALSGIYKTVKDVDFFKVILSFLIGAILMFIGLYLTK